ncbi:DUF3859 domain-containing protein [Tepidibacter hydrothermalis]|uniref:DUF3859 domain-containing protein n=1 Tax=Tepidibacter hydrothermalis TaxID=3036126 RepID=A0ABY8E9T2_9FIRM|nr:DUF3859 domain-containing protein [Tepidibacter hydrothermalis]WFD09698.1 DUF3859 domain-containing protein [Tepidibacter hydrothermalis]
MKITIDLTNRQSVIKAINQWIKIIKSDYYLNNPQEIVIEDTNQGILTSDILKYKSLYSQISEIFSDIRSDLIFILKLIELDMEEEASDIAFELSKLLRQLNDKNYMFIGLDIIYAVSSASPFYSYCLGKAINPSLSQESEENLTSILTRFIKSNKWTDNTLDVFVYCDNENIKERLAELDLKYFLNLPGKIKVFKKIISRKHKQGLSADKVEQYFIAAKINYSIEDINDVLKDINIKKIKENQVHTKGNVIEKESSRELIKFKYILTLPKTTEITIKIDHPENKDLQKISKFKTECIDGQINQFKLCPHGPGVYTVTILVKGRPLIKEKFLIEDKVESKIKDINILNFTDSSLRATSKPFKSMDEPFGIRFSVDSGKIKGLLYHPPFIKETINSAVQTDISERRYLNIGTYNMILDPHEFFDFKPGYFEFLLLSEDESELLHRQVFFKNPYNESFTSKQEEFEFLNNLIMNLFLKEDPKRFNKNVLRQTIGEFEELFKINFFKFLTKEEIVSSVIEVANNYFNSLNGYISDYVDPMWKDKIKSKQKISKTEVLNYGIYEKNKDFNENINISLKSQKKYLKAKIGTYFGISYNLNPLWFKNDINVKCNVSLVKSNKKIIDETWNDISYCKKTNQFVYIIEDQKELQSGLWQFKLYCKDECILKQIIQIDI